MKRTNFTDEKFRKLCKNNSTAYLIGAVILALVAVCGLAAPVYLKLNHRGNIADIIGGMELLTVALAFHFVSRIFRNMGIVGSPFSYDIADKIMGLSQIIEIGATVSFAVSLIIRFTGHGDLIDSSACVDPGIFFLLAWTAASFFSVLAKAFDHGAQLQQESDETL